MYTITNLKKLIAPKSVNKDIARREFILNILLIGSIALAITGFIHGLVTHLLHLESPGAILPQIVFAFLVFLSFLLFLSRTGKINVSAFLLILFLTLSGFYTFFRWGADVPQALLIIALVIIMSGILIGTKSAFLITLLSGLALILFTFLQVNFIFHPNQYWKNKQLTIGDTILSVATLAIMAIISWLSNREIEKSLKRARSSEVALRRQRDHLEIIVERRTKELKFAQAEKLAQLYRFAQFGRMASGLFHDLVNPLNLVSLNLDLLSRKSKRVGQQKLSDIKVLLERAVDGTLRLENFVQAARRQVQHQEYPQTFLLANEITQVIQMLEHKAKKSHVKISLKLSKGIKMFGNSMKFSQLITNLVLNAIDAHENVKRKEKLIEVRLQKINSNIRLEVQDWGSGIHEKYLPKIFDPLFTTKSHGKGIGMGLSICKDVVEKDLKGKCVVKSKIGAGTTFIIEFPIGKNSHRVH